eukprot:gene19824-biopygen5528
MLLFTIDEGFIGSSGGVEGMDGMPGAGFRFCAKVRRARQPPQSPPTSAKSDGAFFARGWGRVSYRVLLPPAPGGRCGWSRGTGLGASASSERQRQLHMGAASLPRGRRHRLLAPIGSGRGGGRLSIWPAPPPDPPAGGQGKILRKLRICPERPPKGGHQDVAAQKGAQASPVTQPARMRCWSRTSSSAAASACGGSAAGGSGWAARAVVERPLWGTAVPCGRSYPGRRLICNIISGGDGRRARPFAAAAHRRHPSPPPTAAHR